jgi:hypothetical protein
VPRDRKQYVRSPANDPLCDVFKCDEYADDGPIHRPSLEFWLRMGEMVEGLEGGETGQEERKPGAVGIRGFIPR